MDYLSSVRNAVIVCAGLIALTTGASPASAGELQNLLDKSKAYAALPRVKHTPAFRLECFEPIQHREQARGKQWWYICDGDERIGLITTWLNHVELFRFSPNVDKGAQYEIPEIYHWANLIGVRLPLQMGGYHSPVPAMTSFNLIFTKDRGDSLEFKTEQTHKDDYTGSTEFRLVWDQRLGYVLHCNSHFVMPESKAIEFNNFMAGWVADLRDRQKRWQKTIRGRLADGRIVFVSERRGGFGRCHGRPVPLYTLHAMDADGRNMVRLSHHEGNEWHPSADDLGAEFERMCLAGSISPDLWMKKATGAPVSPDALLGAAERALARFE